MTKQTIPDDIYKELTRIIGLQPFNVRPKLLEYVDSVKPKKLRTQSQNNSLHLLLSWLAQDCLEAGIDMRQLVKEEVPIEATPENLKWLWKLLQEALLKTNSTTQLEKQGQIDLVYDNFNKIIIERTDGKVSLRPFPHKDKKEVSAIEAMHNATEYPTNDLGEDEF